jgi:tetratricopeptide (TPR) repeat protein
MSPRPAIFISAVSRELGSARQLVANTLTFLGYEPEWQDIFGTADGDLRAMLRRRIDACKGVVQLVGECYGAEPPSIDEQFGRVSYTQYEALYAVSKGKRVWYLFLEGNFPADPHEKEDEEKRALQEKYRAGLQAQSHLYHPLNNKEGLEASVLKLRDDLTQLRRGVRRWAAAVAILLGLSVFLSLWLLQSQQHSNEQQQQTNGQLQALQAKFDQLQQGVNAFAEVQNKVRQEQPGEKPDKLEQRTYEELGKQLGLDAATLKAQLPRFAEQLKKAPNATTYQRANAAYVDKDYNEAERLALTAATEALRSSPPNNPEAIKAFELAAWAAEKRIDYAEALDRLREAEKLTDHSRDGLEWARVQFAIAWVLQDQGRYRDAEPIFRQVLTERERLLGPEHPDTLAARHRLASSLDDQGRYPEAESEYRAVLTLEEKVLGSEHPTTLGTRNNLGNLLYEQGKYADAEKVYRDVLKLKEKVLGIDDPSTFKTKGNLASALDEEGKYSESVAEDRELLERQEKVLGAEHPDTLATLSNLADGLSQLGRYAEAETENRAVLKLKERVLGPEHPDTLITRSTLAEVLDQEGKYTEAEAEYRTVFKIRLKVLGAEHPETLVTRDGLAKVLAEQGQYAEAETEQRAVLELQEKIIGSEHPDTLETRNGLANTLAGEGKLADAEREYHLVLSVKEKVLGPEHPETLQCCFDLAACLRSEAQIQAASEFAQRAAEGARKVLGPDHPITKKYEQLQKELLAKTD